MWPLVCPFWGFRVHVLEGTVIRLTAVMSEKTYHTGYQLLDGGVAGLKYDVDGVQHLYTVPILMHITTSDDFWQTGKLSTTLSLCQCL